MKFVLFVEGETEHRTAGRLFKRWLDPQLRQPVGIQSVKFSGHANFAQNVATKAHMHLQGPNNGEIVGVIGLLDLYGLDYPPTKTAVQDRFDWAKQDFERQVGHAKFRMFFAVHEFEAWLLSDPTIFSAALQNMLKNANIRQPEQVDFAEPPARLLDRIYRQATTRSYKKTVDGNTLFEKLDPNKAVAACPYLKQLLDEMLTMAQNAGL